MIPIYSIHRDPGKSTTDSGDENSKSNYLQIITPIPTSSFPNVSMLNTAGWKLSETKASIWPSTTVRECVSAWDSRWCSRKRQLLQSFVILTFRCNANAAGDWPKRVHQRKNRWRLVGFRADFSNLNFLFSFLPFNSKIFCKINFKQGSIWGVNKLDLLYVGSRIGASGPRRKFFTTDEACSTNSFFDISANRWRINRFLIFEDLLMSGPGSAYPIRTILNKLVRADGNYT